jgi:hypothetical protein
MLSNSDFKLLNNYERKYYNNMYYDDIDNNLFFRNIKYFVNNANNARLTPEEYRECYPLLYTIFQKLGYIDKDGNEVKQK